MTQKIDIFINRVICVAWVNVVEMYIPYLKWYLYSEKYQINPRLSYNFGAIKGQSGPSVLMTPQAVPLW